jgi:hypothetical protein
MNAYSLRTSEIKPSSAYAKSKLQQNKIKDVELKHQARALDFESCEKLEFDN